MALYAWMNGHSTLLHNIAPDKYIVIKVEYGLQLRFKIYFLRNQIEKTTTKIIIKMLMVLDFRLLSLWFLIEFWWYNTLTRENNWFLSVLVRSNFATPTPFGSISCFVIGVDLSNYNLNSALIHQASYSKGYQSYLMHREVFGSIWKIGRYPIKVSEVLLNSIYKQDNRCDHNTSKTERLLVKNSKLSCCLAVCSLKKI